MCSAPDAAKYTFADQPLARPQSARTKTLLTRLLVSERVPVRVHALRLLRSEVVHAHVIDVVHEVADRIVARIVGADAAVALLAEELRLGLGRRVLDLVAGLRARAVAGAEGVLETKPVADFVRAGVALVVGQDAIWFVRARAREAGARQRRPPQHDAVVARIEFIEERQGRPPEIHIPIGRVDVERLGSAFAER